MWGPVGCGLADPACLILAAQLLCTTPQRVPVPSTRVLHSQASSQGGSGQFSLLQPCSQQPSWRHREAGTQRPLVALPFGQLLHVGRHSSVLCLAAGCVLAEQLGSLLLWKPTLHVLR